MHEIGVVQAHRTSSNLHEPLPHRASKVCRVLLHKLGVVQAQRTSTNHTITELARCVGCFCSSSGWFKHSEPTRTTPSQCSRCVGHSFGVVEAQRTSSHLQETHHHRASTVWRVLLHYVGVVQAPRTYTNHTILTSTELARCEGCLSTSSGWFKHSEPHRTCTNHTITELARCVGCFCTSSGGSSTSNLHEPHQHSSSKVCRVLLHEFRVVQAQRTYTNHTITVSKVCRALVLRTVLHNLHCMVETLTGYRSLLDVHVLWV